MSGSPNNRHFIAKQGEHGILHDPFVSWFALISCFAQNTAFDFTMIDSEGYSQCCVNLFT